MYSYLIKPLTTSASYERNQTIEGKTYSHIKHKKELQSGVYSTALMVDPTLEVPFQKILIGSNLNISH